MNEQKEATDDINNIINIYLKNTTKKSCICMELIQRHTKTSMDWLENWLFYTVYICIVCTCRL